MALARLLVTVVAFLVLTGEAFGRYRPPTFRELTRKAELAVLGTIRNVEAGTFDIEIEEVVFARKRRFAPSNGTRLSVRRFQDWTCARRWTGYSAGQSAILLLARQDGQWRVLGPGNEGEFPIADGHAFVSANVSNVMKKWQVHGAEYLGERYSIGYVINSVVNNRSLLPLAPRRRTDGDE